MQSTMAAKAGTSRASFYTARDTAAKSPMARATLATVDQLVAFETRILARLPNQRDHENSSLHHVKDQPEAHALAIASGWPFGIG